QRRAKLFPLVNTVDSVPKRFAMRKIIDVPAGEVGIRRGKLRIEILRIYAAVAENPVEFSTMRLECRRLLEGVRIERVVVRPGAQNSFPCDRLGSVLLVDDRSLKTIPKRNQFCWGSHTRIFRGGDFHLSLSDPRLPSEAQTIRLNSYAPTVVG